MGRTLSSARLPTIFTAMLQQAVSRVPGARGAVFLDSEGEAVDEIPGTSRTAIRLVGAHFGVVIELVRERSALLGSPQELILETEHAVVLALSIDERYLIVLEAAVGTSIGLMRRELGHAAEALRAEM